MKETYTFKHLFFFCFFLIFSGGLYAQYISNATYEFSCPCEVKVTYELTKRGDVKLSYSPTPLGLEDPGWLVAITLTGQATGTNKVIIWNCGAGGATYGPFYYKLERVPIPCEDVSMIFVQGGTYTIGAAVQAAADGATGNGAVSGSHAVTLSDFYMSETQVTQSQFAAVMGTNPSNFQGGVYEPSGCRPVERVDWYDAIAFCNKLSLMEGKTPVYSVTGITDWASLVYASIPTSNNATWNAATQNLSANGYRLPTEAEWEYAARGGNLSASPSFYYSGSNTADSVGWYSTNSGQIHLVGQKRPNALGLYDMSGNVYEWCWDWYATYTAGAVTDPTGPTSGSYRVGRGGNAGLSATYLRVSGRSPLNPEDRGNTIGLRLARSSQ